MFRKHSVTVWIVLGLMAVLATPASANVLSSATATANCSGYILSVSAKDLSVGTKYTIDYSFTLTCNGVVTNVPGTISFTATATTATVTKQGSFPGVSGHCIVTGTAKLTSNGSTVAIIINGVQSAPLTCGVITSNCVVINATQNVAITPVTLTASGGDGGPYTFTATGLPAGLSISTGGTISGTPTVSGTFNYTVTITDGKGNKGTLNCSLTVHGPLKVTCQAVDTGDVGVPFNSGPMTVTGGTPPYKFSIVGTLPPGLTLNTSTGAVTGTPTAAGTFTVKVTDAAGNSSTNCMITINGPLQVTCQAVDTGDVGVPFNSGPMTVTGGTAPYTFSIVGTLPPGLTLNTSTGAVTGTPTAAGTFTVKVTDAVGNSSTNCMITINGPLHVTCQAINTGDVGVPFNSGPMTVTGGTPPYKFSIVGTLPAGLTLNTSTGAVTGTPTAAGTFTVKVTDAVGNSSTNCMITINGPLSVICQAVNTGDVGVPFDSGPMTVTGGTPPYTFSIVGKLPAGLTLDTSTGAVTGTPTAAGSFTVKVTDAVGNSSTGCVITINGPLSVTCQPVDTGDVGVPFNSGPMTVTGGTAPYKFSIVGTLPPGLTLNTSTGAVTGTPTAAGTFTVKVTDAVGNSSTNCMITIHGPLQVTCQAINTGNVGVPFNSGPMTVTGGTPPYTFSIVGTLPAGLTLDTSNGEVTGTPTATGTFTVKVTDAAGSSSTNCMITINGPLCAAGAPGLNLGTDNSYIFIDTGATHLGWNAYQLDGNVLFGQGLTVQLSGGNDGGLGAGFSVYLDSTTKISGSLQNPLTFVSVPTSQTAAAAATAQKVSNFAKGLTATQTFSSINNNLTINGNGGLNVIDVGSIQNANLTINGSANDFFVFNVSSGIQTNQVMTLTGGVTASQILWNLTGTGTVLQTSGGDVLVGTFLATDGGQFQFSELQLTGELINTGGNVQLVSGNHTLTQAGFGCPAN